MNAPEPRLAAVDLHLQVPGRSLVSGLNEPFAAGEITAILGRNGAGKTTLLHTLAGLRTPQGGEVLLAGRRLQDWPRRERARTLGLLMQSYEYPFPGSVLTAVLAGRHPHVSSFRWESAEDHALARAALASVDLAELEARNVDTLSGGERRRLAIATLFAQDPTVMLLDEPVNNLDPRYQVAIMRMLLRRAARGHTVVVSLHDVNLALTFCPRALLLFGDGSWLAGASSEVINSDNLQRLYQTAFLATRSGQQTYFHAA